MVTLFGTKGRKVYLLDIQVSVGLLLADVASMIGLSPDEQAQALGDTLYQELLTLEEQPIMLTQGDLSVLTAE